MIDVERRIVDGWLVLRPRGALDMATAPAFEAELERDLRAGHCRLLVDLSDVDLLDSTGLRMLIASLVRCDDVGGSLRLVNLHRTVRRALEISGIDELFTLHDSVADALR